MLKIERGGDLSLTIPDPSSVRGKSLKSKLLWSHLGIALVGVTMLCLALGFAVWLRERALNLVDLRSPAAHASSQALSGLQRSLAAIRGWITVGTPNFKLERINAWQNEIQPAIKSLSEISPKWLDDQDQKRLKKLSELLIELEEWQWWIEDIAHSAGNQPAHEIFSRYVRPIANEILSVCATLINLERKLPRSEKRAILLERFADLKGIVSSAQEKLGDYVTSGNVRDEAELNNSLRLARLRIDQLSKHEHLFTEEQHYFFILLNERLTAYESLAGQIVTIRKSDKWDIAQFWLSEEALPLAARSDNFLTSMSYVQAELMTIDSNLVYEMSNVAITVSIILICGLCFLAISISRRSASQIVKPISSLVKATQYMAQGDLDTNIPVKSDDEIGQLTISFNRMRRTLKEQRAQLEAQKKALDACAVVAETDPHGHITYVNDQFCQLSQFTREELIGKTHKVINSGRHPKEYWIDFWTTIQSGKMWRGEIQNKAKDGTLYWVDSTIVPFLGPDQKPEKYLAIRLPITERKKAETALQKAMAELERSNTELEQFAYVASHDLQEPLRMVASYTQLLANRYGEVLDSTGLEYVEFAIDGAKRMHRLIEDLLSYSRVGTRGKPFRMVKGNEILDNALKNLTVAVKENNASIVRTDLPPIMGDEMQLIRLFQNLIGNAIKFHGNKQPEIHVLCEAQNGDWIISVRDNGIGINPKYKDRIFQIFQRLHTRDEYSGTGIGLAVCKKIVERHGGKIWVDSEPEKGAAFHFTISRMREGFKNDDAALNHHG
jgi:two-component system, chemotaxis family, sensor kinase Cph1